ncbi:hypothetical protein [Actinoplanes sp. NPDC049118]|uniref:hypothetical protein n=1 Tax=Actinoplanes sp. NPDC049118 TaxID=3155769 RepID=UPI0034075569
MPYRRGIRLSAAFVLALTLAACADDGPTRDEVVAKIKSDPRTADTPATVVNCLADWYMESASTAAREAFVEGSEPPANESADVDAAVLECLKAAT